MSKEFTQRCEAVGLKEGSLFTWLEKVETLQAENAALRAEVERLKAVIESNIDEGINKIMLMSDEQISALAGFEGRSTEDQETIARQCFEIAERRVDHMKLVEENHELRQQLAASQIEAKRMRDELDILTQRCSSDEFTNVRSEFITDARKALSSPTSTDALDAYVAEKVKEETGECTALNDRLAKLLAETAVALKGEEAALTRHSWHDLPVITLAKMVEISELTRHRDLAVSELETIATGFDCDNDAHRYGTYCRKCEAEKALAAIKESESPNKP